MWCCGGSGVPTSKMAAYLASLAPYPASQPLLLPLLLGTGTAAASNGGAGAAGGGAGTGGSAGTGGGGGGGGAAAAAAASTTSAAPTATTTGHHGTARKALLEAVPGAFDAGEAAVATCGGKGYQLAKLLAISAATATTATASAPLFEVPPGAVLLCGLHRYVNAAVTRAFGGERRRGGGGTTAADAAAMREAVLGLDLDAIAPQLRAAVGAVVSVVATCVGDPGGGGLRWAVRSSGASEDGAAASFAGQYDSVLNVTGVDGILDAIKRVWASQFSEHLLAYLARAAPVVAPPAAAADAATPDVGMLGGVALPDMAVVIQVQIASERAGVLFTTNPTAAGDGSFVMEGVWGQGEGLVSGEITPHTLTVQLGQRGGPRVARQAWTSQARKYDCLPAGGVGVVPCTVAERTHGPLDGSLVASLVAAGMAIAAARGAPQDIEWAAARGVLYVVQTRPVTSVAFTRELGHLRLVMAVPTHILDECLLADAARRMVLHHHVPPTVRAAMHLLELYRPPAGSAALGAPRPDGGTLTDVPLLRAPALLVTETGRVADADPLDGLDASVAAAAAAGGPLPLAWAPRIFDTQVVIPAAGGGGAGGIAAQVAATLATGAGTLPPPAAHRTALVTPMASVDDAHAALRAAQGAGLGAVILLAPRRLARDAEADLQAPAGTAASGVLMLVVSDASPLGASLAAGVLAPSAAPALAHLPLALTSNFTRPFHSRGYIHYDMHEEAADVTYHVADPDALEAEMAEAHEAHCEEVMPLVETVAADLLAATLAGRAPTTVWPAGVTEADLLATLRLYRDATYRSWSVVYHAMAVEEDFKAAVADAAAQMAAARVTAGDLLTGVTSRNALDELHAIALRHLSDARLRAVVGDGADAAADYVARMKDYLAAGGSAPAADLLRYLTHYGWMAEADEDFYTPHWAEDPAFPLAIFRKTYLSLAAAPPPTAAAAAGGGAAATGADELPPAHAPLLRRQSSVASDAKFVAAQTALAGVLEEDHALWALLRRLRVALRQKEQVHIHYVRIGMLLRLQFQHWIAAHWPALAALRHDLTPDALMDAPLDRWVAVLHAPATGDRHALADLVAAATLNEFEARTWRFQSSPFSVGGSSKVHDTAAAAGAPVTEAAATGARYDGLAASAAAGEPVRGTARVVTSLKDAHLVQAGDILVAHITSPAWSPLFSLLAGLVLEEGGILSHGAVVARECNIPAVTQIATATALFRSGDIIEVDGAAGTVTLVSRPAP